jgi:hypothetical protein
MEGIFWRDKVAEESWVLWKCRACFSLVSSGCRWEASVTCSERHYLSWSCWWDGARLEFIVWWSAPCVCIFMPGCCCVTGSDNIDLCWIFLMIITLCWWYQWNIQVASHQL